MLDTLLKLDGDILLWIQDNLRAGWLDPIMKFITYLANGGALWIGICVLLLILKKTRTTGIVCSCSLAVTFLINNIILKNIIARTRPYEVVEGLNRIIGAQSDFSFPSGHSGASFAVAVVMFMEMPKKYGVEKVICDASHKDGVNDIRIEAKEGVDIRRDVFETVVKNGWYMLELKTSELSLEDIFLKLTMGEALPALENTSDKEGND